jgi:amidase
MTVHRFEPKLLYYTFGPHPPALTIKPGDQVTAPTVDAFGFGPTGEKMPASTLQYSADTVLPSGNPQVGPIYVDGAEPGDTLVVRIVKIEVNRATGFSSLQGGFGGLSVEDKFAGPMGLNDPMPEVPFPWKLDLQRRTARVELKNSRLKSIEIPMHPFLGCLSVAPRWGQTIWSMQPGEHGGNMDAPEVTTGTTAYLPVWVRGAYLFFGDVHAAQGDGETCGTAIEATADVTLAVDVLKGKSIQWPRLENDEFIMTVGSARPLMDAFRIAHVEMVKWLVADFGFDKLEAYQIITQVGTARIGNVVDPLYTVVARYPKKYLP